MWNLLRSRGGRNAGGVRLGEDPQHERAEDVIQAGSYSRFPMRAAQSVVSSDSRIAAMALYLTLAFTMFILFALRHDRVTSEDRLIGWQQYSNVSLGPVSTSSSITDAALGGTTTTTTTTTSTAITFPLDIYMPILPNSVPLTDITVKKCVALLPCFPPTTPDLDAHLGKWVRVDRYLDSSAALGTTSLSWLSMFFSLEEVYIFYRRSRLPGVQRVVDLRVLEAGQDLPSHLPDDGAGGWKIVETDLRAKFLKSWGGLPGAKLVYRVAEGLIPSKLEPITEVEVVYGPNPPWPGFTEVGTILPTHMKDGTESVTLTIRRTPRPNPTLPQPVQFKKDGTFKIVQIGDLHFSVSHEVCRDSEKNPCVADVDTISLLSKWLDEEKPDMVVLSGDQLNGQATSWDVKSVLPKVTKMLSDRKILFAAIQGNHDSETGKLSRKEQQTLLSLLPYSLTRLGPDSIHGVSNYDIKLHSPSPDGSHIFTLYFLDSGDYPPEASVSKAGILGSGWGLNKGGGTKHSTMKGKLSHYDWVRGDQVQWFLGLSAHVKKMVRPYRPDGVADLKKQPWKKQEEERRIAWEEDGRRSQPRSTMRLEKERRRGNESSPTRSSRTTARAESSLSKPPALMFMHIPVPEAYESELVDAAVGGAGGKMVLSDEPGVKETGSLLEADQKGGQGDRGIFDAIVKQGGEEERDVKAIGFGHNHLNEACRRSKGIWLCFNGGSSYAGYGKPTFARRVRVFHLSDFGNKISTWHRLDGAENAGKRVGEAVLYEYGR
ncbi:unnamed protein product [Tilletia controversa]|uniref:Calcineurin-like phosphoesterase domain-containing protein n=3 Tax=Tilletia TaxID=13289 RepID=A0A8X7MVH3_9BASI|nr:hypothetical protein CF336_g2954 [Tilletia laevis]KAE8200817.1 hypothetical protein CF328_g2859 [Tilletia controversa]KAE8262054.1 hypothetical protein A4X03_0g2760 [Tilletia caries]KAE8199448.1 hypothetical protein CF335_g4170 [Tilletia laevis]KAE8248847.1 hypothetical protein A4X06_0g3500 [Tilletia controversa]